MIEQFRAYLSEVRSENTAQKYSQAAVKFLEFCATNKLQLDRLPRGVLSTFSEYLTYTGLSPGSVHTHSAGAKKFLQWLQAKGMIRDTPFTAPDLPKITTELPNALGENDMIAFLGLANAQHEPQRTAMMLLPFCGLRSEELTHLELKSVARVNAPNAQGVKVPHICLTVRGKGGDMRVVPLLTDGKHILVSYLLNYRKFIRDSPWLFPMHDGSPISTRTLRHYFQQIRGKVDPHERRLTPHTMRRTYATTLWRAGVDVAKLASIMGHKSLETTRKHYLEMRPEDLAGAVSQSGAALLSRGVYADQVRTAGVNVSDFLNTLPNRSL